MKTTGQLTQRVLDDLGATPGRRYVRWDGKLPGFGVRVSAGVQTFIFKYRLKSGRVRWASLGRVGAVALDQARGKAKEYTGIVAAGKDPLSEQDETRGAITVNDVADVFMRDYVEARKKPSTVRLYKLALDSQIRPKLGALPIRDVDDDAVAKLHHVLRATPVMANRTLAVLSKLLSWSTAKYRKGLTNPCLKFPRYPEAKRRRYLTVAEYGRVGKALQDPAITPAVRTAIELLLLTGARPIEIVSLKWSYLDLSRAVLELPDSKTGAKTIHLPPAAVRLLKKWPRFASSDFVFPGTGKRFKADHMHPSTLTHAWPDIRDAAELDPDVRLYDACRHSYASTAVSRHGMSLVEVGQQLGHSQPATTSRYAHLHDDVARQNARMVGTTIAAALKRKVK